MENMNRVIGCPAARVRFPADQSGVTDAANIEAMLVKIIFAPSLTRKFAESVNRIRIHYAILRCTILRRVRPENGDRAWPKNLRNAKLDRKVEHMQQTRHV